MATKPLIPYLPKLKGGNEESVSLPNVLREWDEKQGKIRLHHLAEAIDVPKGAESVYSIPNPWARTILFRRALFDKDHALHLPILEEWRGLIALLALKDVRRLTELSARGMQLSAENVDSDSFRYAVARVLPGNEDAIAQSASWASFHLLCWTGERTEGKARAFAMTSPWTLVATGADYSDLLSEKEVRWFNPREGLLKDPSEFLSLRERSLLAEWLCHVQNGLPAEKGAKTEEIGKVLKQFAKELDSAANGSLPPGELFSDSSLGLKDVSLYAKIDRPIRPTAPVLSECVIETDRPGAPLFVLIDPAIPDALGLPARDIAVHKTVTLESVRRAIPELDRSRSGLFPRASGEPPLHWCTGKHFFESSLIYEQTRSIGGNEDVEAFPGCRAVQTADGSRSQGRHIALPIRQEVLDLFTPGYFDKNLTVEWLPSGDARFRLKLALRTLAPGASSPAAANTLVLERTYAQNEMTRVAKLPLVCLWPNFRFNDDQKAVEGDKKPSNRWARYYLFESWYGMGDKKDQFLVTPAIRQQIVRQRMVTMPDFGANGQKEGEEFFQVTTMTRFPEALVCTMPHNDQQPLLRGEGAPSGLLLLKDPETVNVFQGQDAILGVDFGTTGTSLYCALGQTQDADGKIERLAFHNRLVQITTSDSSEFQRITRNQFLPNSEPANGKILSIFQDFGANGTRSAVGDGHVLFLENSSLRDFVHGDPQSILTNLKWSEDRAVNAATQDFLVQLCMQSLAELISAGARGVELRYSYPTAFSDPDLNNFKGLWNNVRRRLEQMTSIPIDFHTKVEDNCESIAATRFFSHSDNARTLNVARGAISLDIGGGTTDIAVWNRDANTGKPSLLAHTSVKFAGQDIFLAPLRKRPELLSVIDDGGAVSKSVARLNSHLKQGTGAYFAEVDAIISRHGDELLSKLPACAQSRGVKDLLQVIDLGMRGIAFYTGLLVGRLVKDGAYDATLPRISVFIGGNGSRLFNWCALGEADSSSMIVRNFAQNLLAGANFACGNQLQDKKVMVELSRRPKEEVAFGLVMRPLALMRSDDYVNPMAGENYLVGLSGNRQLQAWNTAPDLQTLGTLPVCVDPELKVFREFLRGAGIGMENDALIDVANSVDQEIRNMADKAELALNNRGEDGKVLDPVRKQPLFILALKHVVADKIRSLVSMSLVD